MTEEFKALYKYLDNKFSRIDEQFNQVNARIDRLINHVDKKNDDQDEIIEDHALRITNIESDYRVLTS